VKLPRGYETKGLVGANCVIVVLEDPKHEMFHAISLLNLSYGVQ
jgi:hypothetical protein